jgi:xylan 1,4-beta-xylosidase
MGTPQSPNATQYAQLEKASVMIHEARAVSVRSGRATVEVTVPRQGVALLVLDGAAR